MGRCRNIIGSTCALYKQGDVVSQDTIIQLSKLTHPDGVEHRQEVPEAHALLNPRMQCTMAH